MTSINKYNCCRCIVSFCLLLIHVFIAYLFHEILCRLDNHSTSIYWWDCANCCVQLLIMKGWWALPQHGESDGRDSPTFQRPMEIIQSKIIWAVTVRMPLKRQRERKKGGAARNWIQGRWLKLPALCHWAMTPTGNHPSLFPFYCSALEWLLMRLCWLLHAIVDHERMVSMITAWEFDGLDSPTVPRPKEII